MAASTLESAERLAGQIRQAASERCAVRIEGHNSKNFYGRPVEGRAISTLDHAGIIKHEPSELMIQARSGTPLADIEAALSEHGQFLAFEPPRFEGKGTLGGAVATGLSGPGRPFLGSVRDSILGVSLINGSGELLRFGGQVMKNVAGYDVSRFVTASLGTLGLITDVSLKVLPLPHSELTLVQEAPQAQAIERMTELCAKALPLFAACWIAGKMYFRFWGVAERLKQVAGFLGGDELTGSADWWSSLKNQQHGFFLRKGSLWRIAVPPSSAPMDLPGEWAIDWAGGQRWLWTDEDEQGIRSRAEQLGGHALLFRGADRHGQVFHPLQAPLLRLHRKLKQSMDPHGILNPGRMYEQI